MTQARLVAPPWHSQPPNRSPHASVSRGRRNNHLPRSLSDEIHIHPEVPAFDIRDIKAHAPVHILGAPHLSPASVHLSESSDARFDKTAHMIALLLRKLTGVFDKMRARSDDTSAKG